MTTSSSRPTPAPTPTPTPPPPAGAAKTASAYSRFIPREELGSFAAWSPGSLDSGPDAAPPPHNAAATSPSPAGDGAALQAQVAAARQSGYQDGYRDGLVALDSFKQSFATQLTSQFGQLLRSFDTQLGALEQQMAQALARSAVTLAQRVVRAELHTHPQQVAAVAQQAVDAVLLSARHIRVLVHPDDHALVAAGAAEALQARGARLLAHVDIQRGGCLVESDLGRIDARIESRWQQAAAVFGSELPWADDDGSTAT